jgi:predicted DNA-binding protein (MmcQ/YjbR family)
MMKALVSGVPASKIFRSLIEADASTDARKLGDMLAFNYPGISPAASMAIRRWLSPGKEYEVADEDIDALISHYLKESGYIT